MDLLEFGELLLSWRPYVGIAITCAACRLVFQIVSDDTIGWFFCAPIGIIGLIPQPPVANPCRRQIMKTYM